MESIKQDGILSVLKNEIAAFDTKTQVREIGYVTQVHDGIANVYGLEHAMYGELVAFENGRYGIVQNIEYKAVKVVLLGDEHGLCEGTKVERCKKMAGIAVGDAMLGRVVDALGSPIDGLGAIETTDFFPIEN